MQTQALELRLQAHKDGRHASLQGFLQRQSSTQPRTPKLRRMPRERLKTCERAHRQSQMSKHALHHLLPRLGRNLQGSVRRPHLARERRDFTLVQRWATSLLCLTATIARDQHRSDTRSPTLRKTPNQLLLPPPKGPHQPQCLTP